ncbi:general odorant-binding protein 72 [Orussus abietinus]|uniref:general odorant-binding protein 72 n=1 Tax=Orussus abietinus TaxID=222816 RepID=UPI0006258F89|nr:general odorant-binding protein 72 [Orussus abietinus]
MNRFLPATEGVRKGTMNDPSEKRTPKRMSKTPLLLSTLFLLLLAIDQTNGAMTTEQMQTAAKGFRRTCQGKISVDTALLDGMSKGEFPEDRNLQCYIKCVMNLLRTMRGNKVDADMLVKQVEIMMPVERQDAMKQVIHTCAGTPEAEDACVTAFRFLKCTWDIDPANFFFP